MEEVAMMILSRDAIAPRDPIAELTGFEPSITGAPVSSYDLMAIGPFVVAAVVVAGVRKLRRSRE